MSKMKDSGVEWIGEIPERWEILKSRYFLNEVSIKNHPEKEVLSLYRDYGVIPKNSRSDNHNVTSLDTSNYKLVLKGNLVINKMKAWQGSMAISDIEGIISPAYYIFEVTSGIFDLRFLHYALRNPAYRQEYLRISAGLRIGQWDLNKNEFKNIKYAYPADKKVQKQIAQFLDEKITLIDEIITDSKKSIEELKAYKQSLITEVVTKGLDPNVKLVPSGIDWIGDVPEGWEVTKIKNISMLRNEKDLYESGQKFLALEKMVSYKPGYVDLSTTVEIGKQQVIRSGDVVFSKLRPYLAKVALADFNGFGTGELLVFQDIKIDCKFFMYKFISEQILQPIKASAYGVKMPRANPDFIMGLPLSFPSSISEQQKIADFLDEKTALIDELISDSKQYIEELKIYKQSMIYEYVTGEKRVD